MPDATLPPITTKGNIGEVELSYAFQMVAEYDSRTIANGDEGGRAYRKIIGGALTGAVTGSVYPGSGGDYGVVDADGVESLNARFMIRDEHGEWIYVEHRGYRRPDGYHRVQAYFDAESNGPYAWLNDAAMLATVTETPDGREAIYSYYQAI